MYRQSLTQRLIRLIFPVVVIGIDRFDGRFFMPSLLMPLIFFFWVMG